MAKNTYKQDEVLEEPFDIRHLLRASSYIKKYAGRMVVAILLSGIGGAFGYVAPMIIQRALDLAIPDKNEKLLFSLVGMLVGIYVVSVIFTTIRSRIMVDVSQNIIYDIRKDLFEHLQELPFQYYDDRPHGKILIRVVNYVNSVSDMLSNGLINIVLECFNLLFIVIFMFLVDVQMALVVLCGVPVLCVFMVWIKNKQRRAWQAVSNKNSNLNAYLQENIVGARITQIFAREDENAEIFKDLSQDCRRTWNTAVRYSNLVWPGIDSISVCVRAAIFLAGLVLFGQGSKSLGTIVAISSYASYFWQPIMNLGNIFNNFINNIAYLERIFETMDEPVTVKDAENAVKMPEIRGEVTFDHVNFSYDESKQILKDVSFTVKPGESVALVGPTGAGKSTIAGELKDKLEMDRVEMDQMIVEKQGMSISEIFDEYGEAYFRNLESNTLIELQKRKQTIVSCGGGVVMREENTDHMKKNGRVVLLTAKPETIYERVKDSDERPILNNNMNVEFISGLMDKRKDRYEAVADITVATDGKNVTQICEEIISKLIALDNAKEAEA